MDNTLKLMSYTEPRYLIFMENFMTPMPCNEGIILNTSQLVCLYFLRYMPISKQKNALSTDKQYGD
jgi:hypothetical protein